MCACSVQDTSGRAQHCQAYAERQPDMSWAGMSALFHVLTDVNRSNSFPPDFSCPLFTNDEDNIGTHKDPGRSFNGQVMERSSRQNDETIAG